MADLATTVRERAATIGNRDRNLPAPAQGFGTPDQEKILRLIGLDPRDPKAHAVVAVARRYDLDPVLGHISIIPRSNMPYITRDGYLYIAHRSGQLDGIEVLEGPTRDGTEWHARIAVYRKDMSHAFVYPGRCELGRDNGPEMAITRGERRALRRAFAVTLPREFGDDDGTDLAGLHVKPETAGNPAGMLAPERPPEAARRTETAERGRAVTDVPLPVEPAGDYGPDPADQPGPELLHEAQRRAIFRLASMLGLATDDKRAERLALFSEIVGRDVASSTELSRIEAQLLVRELDRRISERDEANRATSIQEGSTDAG